MIDPDPPKLTRAGKVAWSVVEDRQIKLAESLGVSYRVDLDDLPATDREYENHQEPSPWSDDDAHGSIDERWLCGPGTAHPCPPGHGHRAADFSRCTRGASSTVAVQYHVRVDHREKGVEVPAARGRKKGVDDFSLPGEIGVGSCRRSLTHAHPMHPAAGAAGELSCCRRGAFNDGSDLLKGYGKHVVQHEREPLGGSQRLKHHEQGETD